MTSRPNSEKLYQRAQELMPAGVNSPVRAFKAVGGNPVFVSKGEGPYIHDADGNRYLDFVCSWGPLILGHAHPAVVEAIQKAAVDGTSFGWATGREVALAERVIEMIPSLERVRFVNSGTEATMATVRLARGATMRDLIVKCAGCYHGHADPFLSESSGSGVATFGVPGSSGVPEGTAKDTLTVPFNDLDAMEEVFTRFKDQVAGVIIEPLPCNLGMMHPKPEYLQGLRKLCDSHGVLLIFDEVISGFRLGPAGAQGRYDVRPDLTAFGKVIGGGLPVGAYGGSKELMERIAPLGPVYQAGTLSGNPLAMAAGLAIMEEISRPRFYETLEEKTNKFVGKIREGFAAYELPARIDQTASIFYILCGVKGADLPHSDDEVRAGDQALFGRFFQNLLAAQIAIAPSAFEVGFVSAAHTDTQLAEAADTLVQAMRSACK